MGRFNLSHDHTLTGDMGKLIPITAMEVLPGDVFRHQTSILVRTTPLLAPVMHPVYIRVHHFFVPNRIVDDNWEDFITTKDGRDATNPTITLTAGSVADHMGLQVVAGDQICAHPIRAYNLIWNEWFRDQDLQTPIGQDQQTLQSVAWGRDYFTKARPEPQQGDAVTVPISAGGVIPVDGVGYDPSYTPSFAGYTDSETPNSPRRMLVGQGTASTPPTVNLTGNAELDINQLRRSLFLQQQAEQRMRYGSRYVDLLRQFGVRPQDSRLDKPELLGGASRPISFSEVIATAEGTGVDVGDLYGHGLGVCTHRPYRRMFPEHGWVISLVSVVPRTQYMNAVPKQFLRVNPPDYWFPESEIEGPQAIENREVYAAAGTPEGTWGWTGRHDEYRSKLSYVSGEIRNSLDAYTYARSFGSFPALNSNFISSTPTDRVYSDNTVDQMRIFASHRISSRRPVSQNPMV